MDEPISAADANRNFSQILRKVREGVSYLVTSHGKPVARITPATDEDVARALAKERLLARLRTQPIVNAEPWTRDKLYDD